MKHPGGTAPFFLLAFGITWGLQWPAVLVAWGVLSGNRGAFLPLAMLGIFGPAIAATVMALREGGMAAVRALYAPLLRWRVPAGWYVAALLPPVLLVGALASLNAAGRQGPVLYWPGSSALAIALVISVAEEVGWRGHALPRLQQRFGSFAAATLLGVIWCLWHVPMFLGLGIQPSLLLVMLLYFTGASLVATWINDGTRQSLLLAVLVHFGAHLNNSHRALPDELVPLVAHAVIYAGLGVLVMRGAIGVGRGSGFPRSRETQDGFRRSCDGGSGERPVWDPCTSAVSGPHAAVSPLQHSA